MGRSELQVIVLRLAECVAAGTGSRLFSYLSQPRCFRPIGFDPMINVISIEDVVRALLIASDHAGQGVFNVPGKDTMPLSIAIARAGVIEIALPGPLCAAIDRLQRSEFTYPLNTRLLHFGGVLDGRRAKEVLGFEPYTPAAFPTRGEAQRAQR